MAQKIKLKPCPFCGKDTVVSDTGIGYSVVCKVPDGGCGASGRICMTEEEAADAWNKRESYTKDEIRKILRGVKDTENDDVMAMYYNGAVCDCIDAVEEME